MQIVVGFIPGLILVIIAAAMIIRDPRRLRCAVFAGLAVYWIVLHCYLLFTEWSWDNLGQGAMYVLPAVVVLALLGVILLGVLFIHYGVVLLRKEGLSLSHALSLVLGILILGYIAALVVTLITNVFDAFLYLFLLALPLVYLAFVLVAFVVYQAFYGFWAKRRKYASPAIVVLGSGIIQDRLPPLLRARVDLGIEHYDREVQKGLSPTLVLSGGQGPGEAMPEGEAMAKYCVAQGIPEQDLIAEAKSRNTEQNLLYSKDILRQIGSPRPWLVVTSDFHAFRAATLMSTYHVAGQAIGARTPRYFWSAAILREYVALLKYHWKLNLAFMLVAIAPLIIVAVNRIAAV